MKTEIDYSFCNFTERVGYIIYYISEYNTQRYSSPMIFNSIEDAYYEAVREISGK